MNLDSSPIARLVVAARRGLLGVQPQWLAQRLRRRSRSGHAEPPAILFPTDPDFPVMNEFLQVTTFRVERTLTSDAVPLDVVATLFWSHHGPEKSAPAGEAALDPVAVLAQASLAVLIGATGLATLLADREAAEAALHQDIVRQTAPWGLAVRRAVIHTIRIPDAVQAEADKRHLEALAECLAKHRRAAESGKAGPSVTGQSVSPAG